MDMLDLKNDEELLASTLAEIAKSQNELRCAQRDLDKAQSRIGFALLLINNLIKRQKD
jgi:hypothetical protein